MTNETNTAEISPLPMTDKYRRILPAELLIRLQRKLSVNLLIKDEKIDELCWAWICMDHNLDIRRCAELNNYQQYLYKKVQLSPDFTTFCSMFFAYYNILSKLLTQEPFSFTATLKDITEMKITENFIVLASDDKNVLVFDYNGKCLQSLNGHRAGVWTLAITDQCDRSKQKNSEIKSQKIQYQSPMDSFREHDIKDRYIGPGRHSEPDIGDKLESHCIKFKNVKNLIDQERMIPSGRQRIKILNDVQKKQMSQNKSLKPEQGAQDNSSSQAFLQEKSSKLSYSRSFHVLKQGNDPITPTIIKYQDIRSKYNSINNIVPVNKSNQHKASLKNLLVITGCVDKSIRFFQNSSDAHQNLSFHTSTVRHIKLTKNFILSAGRDGLINIFNFSGVLLKSLKYHKKSVRMIDWRDNWLVSGGYDGMVLLWRVKDAIIPYKQNQRYNLNSSRKDKSDSLRVPRISGLANSNSTSSSRATPCSPRKERNFHLFKKLQSHLTRVYSVSISQKYIVSGGSDALIHVNDKMGRFLYRIEGHRGVITGLQISKGFKDQSHKIRDLDSLNKLYNLHMKEDPRKKHNQQVGSDIEFNSYPFSNTNDQTSHRPPSNFNGDPYHNHISTYKLESVDDNDLQINKRGVHGKFINIHSPFSKFPTYSDKYLTSIGSDGRMIIYNLSTGQKRIIIETSPINCHCLYDNFIFIGTGEFVKVFLLDDNIFNGNNSNSSSNWPNIAPNSLTDALIARHRDLVHDLVNVSEILQKILRQQQSRFNFPPRDNKTSVDFNFHNVLKQYQPDGHILLRDLTFVYKIAAVDNRIVIGAKKNGRIIVFTYQM